VKGSNHVRCKYRKLYDILVSVSEEHACPFDGFKIKKCPVPILTNSNIRLTILLYLNYTCLEKSNQTISHHKTLVLLSKYQFWTSGIQNIEIMVSARFQYFQRVFGIVPILDLNLVDFLINTQTSKIVLMVFSSLPIIWKTFAILYFLFI